MHTESSTHSAPIQALSQGGSTVCHSQAVSNVHQQLDIARGLSEGPPTPYCKYVPQSVLQNSRTVPLRVHNNWSNRP
jgi:hypothetical protein